MDIDINSISQYLYIRNCNIISLKEEQTNEKHKRIFRRQRLLPTTKKERNKILANTHFRTIRNRNTTRRRTKLITLQSITIIIETVTIAVLIIQICVLANIYKQFKQTHVKTPKRNPIKQGLKQQTLTRVEDKPKKKLKKKEWWEDD